MAVETSNGSELRQRKNGTNGAEEKTSPTNKSTAPAETSSVGLFDIVRALAGVALISTIGSYAVTEGESLTWGLWAKRPWWADYKAVTRAMQGPLLLTNEQLSAYDGSDPDKPILLAINRTIYDVSASPNVYGVGGAYSALAAKDASRSYITTCFDPLDDLVPYFGGVEEVYVPLWLSKKPSKEDKEKEWGQIKMFGDKDADDMLDDIHKKVGRKNIKPLREKAYAAAHERVKQQIKMWEGMFEKKGYPVVGRVVGVDEEDPNKWRHLTFCDKAKKLRPSTPESLDEAMKSLGKGDKMKLDIGKMQHLMKPKDAKDAEERKKNKKKAKAAAMKKKKKDKTDEELDAEFKEAMGIETDDDDDDKEKLADLANTRIEDMLKGGKHFGGNKENVQKIQELLKDGPENADPEALKKALELLKERKKAASNGKSDDQAAQEIPTEGSGSEEPVPEGQSKEGQSTPEEL